MLFLIIIINKYFCFCIFTTIKNFINCLLFAAYCLLLLFKLHGCPNPRALFLWFFDYCSKENFDKNFWSRTLFIYLFIYL